MMGKILQALDTRPAKPLLADGAMGTLLVTRGVPAEDNLDWQNVANPDAVARAHRDYLAAGSQILETNTFGANRFKLAAAGLEAQQENILRAGAEIARAEAGGAGGALVAGSIGPLGIRLAPYGRVKAEQAEEEFRRIAAILLEGGADFLLIETMSDVREALAALRAARAEGARFVGVSFAFTRDGLTLLGDSPEDVARAAADAGADLVGANCSSGPAQTIRLLRAMRAAAPHLRLSAMPNAGWPERLGGRILYPAGADYFGRCAAAFADEGASVIGGCCGTEPAHIAAMRAALDDWTPRREAGAAAVTSRPETKIEVSAEPTRLAAKLASGKFTVSVEVDPPKGFSTHKLMAGASMLAEAGADVINVADSPMARMRMSPWAVCHLIQEQFGVETVLHFPTRGRSLLRLQGDLLAAHALGVRNLFVVMGDPTAIGDFPQAADNYDIVPSGLIRMIKQSFNLGKDHAGKDIGAPTAFFVGCALNLTSATPEKEMRNLQKKLDAGADFILTQPLFEPDSAAAFRESFRREYGELRAPILAGILPLYGARHAAFLHNEVPGMSIPEAIRSRIERAGEKAPEEGVRIAVELLNALRGTVQGAYLMPPFGRYDLAAEVIEGLG